LGYAVSRSPEDESIRKAWLDSILPLIVDPENTVQTEAFEAVKQEIFEPISKGDFELFSELFSESHFDFMKNVFTLYKPKSLSLRTSPTFRVLETTQHSDCRGVVTC
jgi:hypothetical protein